jgi:hypothetical protein
MPTIMHSRVSPPNLPANIRQGWAYVWTELFGTKLTLLCTLDHFITEHIISFYLKWTSLQKSLISTSSIVILNTKWQAGQIQRVQNFLAIVKWSSLPTRKHL